MPFQAPCPTCGAEVTFTVASSLVAVCPYCETLCGRGDGRLESYGKVADLVQTDSPLQLGLRGEIRGKPFEIVGRIQYRHAAGGVWDEWYCAFQEQDRWAWLAEAQGRWYITAPAKIPSDAEIPALADLELEQELDLPKAERVKVVEIGQATVISAEGELPSVPHPGAPLAYVDFSGTDGTFATLSEDEGVRELYVGGEYTLEQLGLSTAVSREEEVRQVPAVQLSCPSCGGSLELRAPDQSLRIACSYCGSLHEVKQGHLVFIHKATEKKVTPKLPLGAKGKFDGHEYTVIGFLQRRIRYEGVNYYWEEYLLYRPRSPFKWLICSNDHWTLGEGIPAGEVKAYGRSAACRGLKFRLFETSTPEVTYVLGEFYWKIEVGERVHASDFVHPPHMLSREAGSAGDGNVSHLAIPKGGHRKKRKKGGNKGIHASEVNWTLGTYMPLGAVAKAFGVTLQRRPSNIAPNQPYPHKGVYRAWLYLMAAAIIAGLLIYAVSPNRVVYEESFVLPKSTTPTHHVFSSQPITLRGRNLRVVAATTSTNSWMYIDGDFFDQKSGKVREFTVPIETAYAGRTRSRSKYLSALPRGTYTLQMDVKWHNMSVDSPTLMLRIYEGPPRLTYWMFLALALSLPVILTGIHHFNFESRRWSESDFSPFS